MQSIATTAGLGIDERNRQVVAAEKPEENPGRDRLPFGIAVRAPRDQARRNRRGGFQRLLIESARRLSEFAKARRTHRAFPPRGYGEPWRTPKAASRFRRSPNVVLPTRPKCTVGVVCSVLHR